jgi:hypothetical protein
MRLAPNWPRTPLVLLGILVASLYLLQYAVLPRYDHLPLVTASFFDFRMALVTWGDWHWADAVLLAFIFVLCAALLLVEIRGGQLSRLLELVLASERATRALLALTTLVSTRYYFASGESHWAGDASAHMAYAYAAARAIAHFEWPLWTNLMGVGTPYLQYYGFLYFYLVGLVDLLVGNFFVSIKISLALGHWLSAFGMYFFARTACRSRAAGLLAALAYTLSFWHVQQVLHMGRYPLSLFYGLLPWPFYFFERLRASRTRAHLVLGGAITLGALALTHPGYGFWATFFFALYAGARLLLEQRWRTRPIIISTVLLFVGAALFGAYLTAPMWLERMSTGLGRGVVLSGVADPSWKRVFIWSNLRFPALPLSLDEARWYGGYIGNSLFLVALAGFALAQRHRPLRRHLPHLAGGLCLALALLLVFGYRLPFLQALPVVTALNAGRYLLFVCFFAALCSALGAAALRRRFFRSTRGRTLLVPLLFVLADLGPTTIQQPFTKASNNPTHYSKDQIDELRAIGQEGTLAAGELPNYRLLTNVADMHVFLATTWLMCRTGLPTPQADHRYILPSMSTFVRPFERYIDYIVHHFDAPDGSESAAMQVETNRIGMHLLNARYLLDTHKEKGVLLLAHESHSPIVVAPTLAARPSLPDVSIDEQQLTETLQRYPADQRLAALTQMLPVAQLIADMEVVPENNSCARIFAPDADSFDAGTVPSATVVDHRVWHQRAEIEVDISASCYARLAYAYSPTLVISVDGQEVQPRQTSGGFIAIPLEAGRRHIVLKTRMSALRSTLLGIDFLLLFAALALAWRAHKKSL